MRATIDTPRTPISTKADRGDERVRLIEEAVLLIRGEWPAAASGICETVNRATGIFTRAGELDAAIDDAAAEAERLVERLFGPDALSEVRGRAAAECAGAGERSRGRERGRAARRRPGAPVAARRRAHAPAG